MNEASFSIFVVEDDEWYRKLLVYTLELNPDFKVKAFEDGKSLLAALMRECRKVPATVPAQLSRQWRK